jgi:hypothetical protein
VVGSMVKLSHYGYRFRCAHGCLHHQGEALALKCGHHLRTHLLPYDYPDFSLSGGAGVAVLPALGPVDTVSQIVQP